MKVHMSLSNTVIDLNSITEDDLYIEDIAHVLANHCRYGGRCRKFYSVAEHCVRCAEMVYQQTSSVRLAKAALLHDAHEAYLTDVPQPLHFMLNDEYSELVNKIDWLVHNKWLLDYNSENWELDSSMRHPIVKEADFSMLWVERETLFPKPREGWAAAGWPEGDPPVGWPASWKLNLWSPVTAQSRFLTLFHMYGGET